MTAAAGAKASHERYNLSDRTNPKVLLIGGSQCTEEATGPNFHAQLDQKVGFDVVVSCSSGGWIALSSTRATDAFKIVDQECKKHKPSVVVLFHGASDVFYNQASDSWWWGWVGSLESLKAGPGQFVQATRTACGADTKIILAQGVVNVQKDTAFNILRTAMQVTAESTPGVTFADMGSWGEIQAQKDQYCPSGATYVGGKAKDCDNINFCRFLPNKNCPLLEKITTTLANSIKSAVGLS